MKRNTSNTSSERASRLAEMVVASRGEGEPRLSGATRSRILRESLQRSRSEGPPALFTPTRHLLVAGALPLVLAVALLVGFEPDLRAPAIEADEPPQLAVSKVDGRVLFDIRNGGKPHVLYRSTDPRGFAAGEGVRFTGGEYEEGLQDQADLVFYRID